MIKVRNLSKTFEYYKKAEGVKGSITNLFRRQTIQKQAVDDVSFDVADGEILGFLGPNGAGKTTTLKMLSGILYPTSGEININGFVPFERKTEYKKSMTILLGNKSHLWADLPALDSFAINKKIYELEDSVYKARVAELSEMFDVHKLLNVQVRRLSLGEKMKLEIIASLLHNPQIIFLDEPTIGLDLISQKSMREFILDYNKRYGATIIITSHNTADIEALCKRVIIISGGKLSYDGQISMIDAQINKYKIIKIKTDDHYDKGHLLALPGVTAFEQGDAYSASLQVEREKVNSVAAKMLEMGFVSDINITEYPIERQIENMFLKKN